jgi:hypothetical protein
MPETLKLPEGYRIDETGGDSIVLYYLTEVVDTYTKYAPEKYIILDAQEHAKQRENNLE